MASEQSPGEIDRQTLLALVAKNYPEIARSLLNPLLDLASISREACNGDTDKFVIMLVVAVRTTEHPLYSTFSPEDMASGAMPVFPSLGTNVRSIAESTGTPRETVRRKVGELIETGWISREGNELRYTAQAYRELTTVRMAIERMAVQNYEVVASLARKTAVQ